MIEYFNEDCMVGMARYPDKHFDLAIVDPPYGLERFKTVASSA
jgi:site-specific DNA-methyltransferase (adenine-specific)